ncbi:MAG: GNAT family N-acetyltransferase [Chloroflexota bacterium]
MSKIQPLTQLQTDDLYRLVTGYTADTKYAVRKTESDQRWVLTLELVPVTPPYRKRYNHLDGETVAQYQQMVSLGFSFAAYDGAHCVGLALAEPQQWNKSLLVWELHVADTHQGRGIGRQLVVALTEKARAVGLRTLVCETQNTNVPAIRFYRRVGFHIAGVDISYYSNDDFPDGEIALFMKKEVKP